MPSCATCRVFDKKLVAAPYKTKMGVPLCEDCYPDYVFDFIELPEVKETP